MTALTMTAEFSDALEKLHAGVPVFLTGRAGTGKSTLIRTFLEDTSRSVVVAAPTGIAALNVGGYTLHRLFSFPAGITPEQVRSGDYRPGRFMKTLKALDTLVIDEISMVRADLFDCLVLALEQFGPKPGTPFGGVQLVLVGDLHQLPPVVTEPEREHFQTYYDSPFFFSGHQYAASSFAVVELTTVFRQLNDTRMVEILNAVRDGGLLEEARTELNRHTDPEFEPPLDEFWLTLATTNRIAGARNRRMLERLPAHSAFSTARITGELDGMERPAEEVLEYKAGAQIMLLTNDPADRWVNGTLAKITETLFDDDGEPYVVVELPDGSRATVERHLWEVTRPSVAGGQLTHEVVGTFSQLPFRLAWAITIHKSQGQTLDRVVVDLTGGTFADGQLYVALSRCRFLDGMVLTRDVLPKDLRVDQRVRRFLRSQAPALQTRGSVYFGVCWVGDEGSRWKPRPIELAVVTDDGQQASTLVNPTRDLGSARTDYGITAADVELAPLLEQAWAALAPLLSERTPIGLHVDQALSRIDFELKRNQHVTRMPLGTELDDGSLTWEDRTRLSAPTALERALAARDIAARRGLTGEEPFPAIDDRPGYLMPRSAEGVELLVHAPGLDASDDDRAAALTEALRVAADRAALSPTAHGILQEIEAQLGTQILDGDQGADVDLSDVLSPGARVCFTGTAHGADGRELSRYDVESLAASHGLAPVANVTKTRCDALVVAELGTQSGKAKKAAQYGKPILAFADFLAWAEGTSSPVESSRAAEASSVRITAL
ncbi:AAA family ATPase [Kocuria palustris]|uniref:AAA family ATPase n=1 Tax=Kocuria palustris TaxID=71999 RepID=UPI0021A93E66|nr:AAA family ATPase [Kocuria palustris]MCT1833204.1 AAA family ATPase [Kocuria palustris]